MSSPQNDAGDGAKVIPLTPDIEGTAGSADAPRAGGALLTSDPLKTLELKPKIVEVLSTIYDPEIPVNIYELGLVYDVTVDAQASVEVRMTLTAPGCPAAQTLPVQVEQRVRDVPGVKDVRVEIVWEPPWTKDLMSDAAKLQLGIF